MKHAWMIGLFVLLWPIGSLGLQRGVVMIEDAGGQQVSLYRESHALLIGVSQYTGRWRSLPGVRRDLDAVKAALERHGFEVEVVHDPDQTTLLNAYDSFIRRYGLSASNRLLFYFAGHGYTLKPAYAVDDQEEWMGYIVTRDAPLPDADFGGFLENAMSMQRFEELAKQIQSKHVLFVFDSGFSGSVFALTRAPPENVSHESALPVRQFIILGSTDEEAPYNSEFRRQFVSALAGAGDLTGDGYITGSELARFLQEKVSTYSNRAQTPQYGKLRHRRLDRGEFIFSLGKQTESPASQPTLTVRSNVYDDKVYIDGREMGSTPLSVDLAPGRHTVRIEKDGYFPSEENIELKEGQDTVTRGLLFRRPPGPTEQFAPIKPPKDVYVVESQTPVRGVRPVEATSSVKTVDFGTYYALIIGNENYRHLRSLKTAIDDAEAVKVLLEARYGFKKENVILLSDATRADILRALTQLRRRLRSSDNLLIYYAGHGQIDNETERGYWLPVDAEPDVPVNWVANGDITNVLAAMHARHVLVVSDSCYSGTLTRAAGTETQRSGGQEEWVRRMAARRSRTVLTSGALEPVRDSGGGNHSVFAKSFLDTLRENENIIDMESLYNKIKRRVVLNAHQTPLCSDIRFAGHEDGDFVLKPR